MRLELLLALVVIGTALIAIAAVRDWLNRENTEPVIEPIVPGDKHYKFVGHDEALELKARIRRDIAASLRQRSALVASGSPSTAVLRLVKRS